MLSLNQASAQAFERGLWRELRRELQKNRVKWMLFMGEKKKRLMPQMLRDQAFRRMVPVVGLEPTRCRHQRILSPSRLPIPSHWPVDTGLLYRRSERNSSPFSHALTPYRSARRTIRRAQRLWVLYSFIRPPSSLAETRLPLPVSQFRIARASA